LHDADRLEQRRLTVVHAGRGEHLVSAAAKPAAPRAPQHPWAVVAPWWKWPDVANTMSGRLTRPEFQKYETSKLVDEFIKDPQRCLKFVDEDLVHIVQPAAPITVGAKPRRFSDLEYVIDPLRTRKIFLDTHKRFYLVVCQIHCDAPGFPRASRDDVCNAGFVVRRRTTDIPAAGVKEVAGILKNINSARGKLGVLEAPTSPPNGKRFTNAIVSEARASVFEVQRASTLELLTQERARLRDWTSKFKVVPQLQGWFPEPGLEKVGKWLPVDANPRELGGESVFPMYPLIPSKNDAKHSGRFGTIYFGLLPTGTGDTDAKGNARFDDQQYYEVTCFATRHLVPHDRGSPCGCPDTLFWSLPTLPYRLAPHFDVVGTGKRPVTIQLPDIDALAAQSQPTLGVAFAKPKGSLMVTGNKDGKIVGKHKTDRAEICSISIPLITIVATFVFELFLPVVTILFGLWFLLKLKFCIPPEISLAAGVTAEISLDASVSVEASLTAAVDASIQKNFGSGAELPADQELIDALTDDFSPIATANMTVALAAAESGNGPDLLAGVEYENEVVHP
jgi:hypothetical protein